MKMVAPLARSLAVLGAFAPRNDWLGNRDLAARTGLPASTVSRIVRALASLGHLQYSPSQRKYRLTAAVLSLGYAASSSTDLQHVECLQMQAFAEQHNVHVSLGTRDRLDVIVLGTWSRPDSQSTRHLEVGVRLGIASSPIGWALLAALPEAERLYLMQHVERRPPREWGSLRRRSGEAIAEIRQKGFCSSLGGWHEDRGIVATPLTPADRAPLVLACVVPSSQLTRARVERVLGPGLRGMARALQASTAG